MTSTPLAHKSLTPHTQGREYAHLVDHIRLQHIGQIQALRKQIQAL